MKVIKNGKEKTFFCKCTECATEFEYDCNDIFIKKEGILSYNTVICPICGDKLYATLQTEEEFEFYKSFPRCPYSNVKL